MTTTSSRFPSNSQQSMSNTKLSSDQHSIHLKIPSSSNSSMLSRTMSSTSIQSNSTLNTTFDTHWLPNSMIVGQEKLKVSLKLNQNEIDSLRYSWSKIISNSSSSITPISSSKNISTFQFTSNSNNSFTSSLFCIQFYQNLISMNPVIEKLIPSIKHQASAFAGVINIAMSTLDDLSRMNESLENLGRLHSRILGIESEYFKIMGEALIKTFKDRFSDENSFSLELEEAWIKLYCFLANSILQGGIDPIIKYGADQDSINAADDNTLATNNPDDLLSVRSSSSEINSPSTVTSEGSAYTEYIQFEGDAPTASKSSTRFSQKARSYLTSSKYKEPTGGYNGYGPLPLKNKQPALKALTTTTTTATNTKSSKDIKYSKSARMKKLRNKGANGEDCIIM
ncbi:hypothetical protein CANARDRAFT_20477 [[Candida] arabinofermentans NRRL YB-2248]|uniref:Globin domain-containing protein n=1 Tax=[Candida] arabinofermentans NRRL YB-2248 TaxID=983967 RepID=A0A1E4T7K6_9ASCO|nr:hypothetical protein CANARDRAFT_20477 [[Candida] arabinofermentans NRRL YB-2248]